MTFCCNKQNDHKQIRGGEALFQLAVYGFTVRNGVRKSLGESSGRRTEAGLPATARGTTSDQGTRFMAKAPHQEPWRRMLAGWQAGLCSASFLTEPRSMCQGMVLPWRTDRIFTKRRCRRGNWIATCRRVELEPYPSPRTSLQSKCTP